MKREMAWRHRERVAMQGLEGERQTGEDRMAVQGLEVIATFPTAETMGHTGRNAGTGQPGTPEQWEHLSAL